MKRREWTKELLRQKREKERQEILDYRSLTDEVLALKDRGVLDADSLLKTTRLLNANPELNVVWNYRRQIIKSLSSTLDVGFWDGELMFTMEKLKTHPKVYWIWNHRVWCLENYPNSPLKIWLTELGILSKLLEMDARNFHGWHYRRFIVRNLERIKQESLDYDEFAYTTKKINQNISNFSAWFQRTALIENMIERNEISNIDSFIDSELEYIKNAMFTDAEDQSVWTYLIWFIRDSALKEHMKQEKYSSILKEFTENIILINNDDISFSGKENIWCLKTLLVIEDIQCNVLHEDIQPKSKEYLEKLIIIDPLRRNRYKFQLESL